MESRRELAGVPAEGPCGRAAPVPAAEGPPSGAPAEAAEGRRGLAGVVAEGPCGRAAFVPAAVELLSCGLAEVAPRMRALLAATFGLEQPGSQGETAFRVVYGLRDLDDESTAAAFLEALGAGRLCVVKVLFRLLGGKGGFGALLKKQFSRGKKTTNVDACRDLSGRRLRHSKAVERIKEWMEKKKRDDELVAALTAEGPELPAPTPASESLDPEYLRKLKQASADRPAVVRDGLRAMDAEAEAMEPPKRARLSPAGAAGAASGASAAAAEATIGHQDALGMLSGSSSPEYEEDSPAETPGGGSSSAAAVPASASKGASGAAAGAEIAPASASSSAGGGSASGVKLRAPQSLARVFSKDPKTPAASAAGGLAHAPPSAAAASAASEASLDRPGGAGGPPPEKPAAGARGASAAGAVAPEDGLALDVAEVRRYSSPAELVEKVSADTLKRSLQALGLKCGGTPAQRAERLFLLKDRDMADLPRGVLAAPART